MSAGAAGPTVRVRIPAGLRAQAGGQAELAVALPDLGEPATVGRLLDHLRTLAPDLERRVRDERGHLRRHVNVFVGTDNVRDRDEQDTVLAPGAEVAIIAAVSGG